MKISFAKAALMAVLPFSTILAGCNGTGQPSPATPPAPPPSPAIRATPLDRSSSLELDEKLGRLNSDFTYTVIPKEFVHTKFDLPCVETNHGHAFVGRGGLSCDWNVADGLVPATPRP